MVWGFATDAVAVAAAVGSEDGGAVALASLGGVGSGVMGAASGCTFVTVDGLGGGAGRRGVLSDIQKNATPTPIAKPMSPSARIGSSRGFAWGTGGAALRQRGPP
jgi:hypothetical protein